MGDTKIIFENAAASVNPVPAILAKAAASISAEADVKKLIADVKVEAKNEYNKVMYWGKTEEVKVVGFFTKLGAKVDSFFSGLKTSIAAWFKSPPKPAVAPKPVSELAAHTAALVAHTVALIANTAALVSK